jgi:hemerythrin-like metal-binding protein
MRDSFPWQPAIYALPIDDMELQHRFLLTLMNELDRRDAGGASKAELAEMLERLRTFTLKHFSDEEAYMAKMGCAKLEIHQLIHRDLAKTLDAHIREFEAGNGRLGHKLLSYVKFWLSAHIRGADEEHLQHCRSTAQPPT